MKITEHFEFELVKDFEDESEAGYYLYAEIKNENAGQLNFWHVVHLSGISSLSSFKLKEIDVGMDVPLEGQGIHSHLEYTFPEQTRAFDWHHWRGEFNIQDSYLIVGVPCPYCLLFVEGAQTQKKLYLQFNWDMVPNRYILGIYLTFLKDES